FGKAGARLCTGSGKPAGIRCQRPGVHSALRSLNFATAFPTDPRKTNNLVLTVDQEVGGSNPPSCTKDLALLLRIPLEIPISCWFRQRTMRTRATQGDLCADGAMWARLSC